MNLTCDVCHTYNICVRLYGMFDNARVVGCWAPVPAAVQPDEWATAVVARELAIWENGTKDGALIDK